MGHLDAQATEVRNLRAGDTQVWLNNQTGQIEPFVEWEPGMEGRVPIGIDLMMFGDDGRGRWDSWLTIVLALVSATISLSVIAGLMAGLIWLLVR